MPLPKKVERLIELWKEFKSITLTNREKIALDEEIMNVRSHEYTLDSVADHCVVMDDDEEPANKKPKKKTYDEYEDC